MIKCDFNKYTSKFISSNEKIKFNRNAKNALNAFLKGELSYLNDLNTFINRDDLNKVLNVAEYVRGNCDVFIVIGIGGSFMGSKAIIDALLPTFGKKKPEIIFMGTDLSSDYCKEVIEHIKDKNIMINVISKSGDTLETNIAFDIITYIMKGKYSDEEIKDRIIVTTDSKEGHLRRLSEEEGYFTLEIPENVGGRFTVFTTVGLFPLAVAGIDILQLLEGFIKAETYIPLAIDYAVSRESLFKAGKYVESFTVYNPKLYYFTEWLKQLFAETQGKNGKGILPISNINTRDLHSLGQFIQEGSPIIFETVIGIENASEIFIDKYKKTLNEINRIAQVNVCEAHYKDKTPSIVIDIDYLNEYSIGEMVRFFMVAAIAGAILIDVNPFGQPGVEKYKSLINASLKSVYIF